MDSTSDEFAGIEFVCPQCGTTLDQYRERCPVCGRALDEDYCATYRLPMPPAVKLIALVLLLGGAVMIFALLWAFAR